MKESIKNTLVEIVCAALAVGTFVFPGCKDNKEIVKPKVEYSQKQQTEYSPKQNIIDVKRNIKYLENNVYQVDLKIDIDENKGLNNFIITEHCPQGWEILDVNNKGLYGDELRARYNIINWIGLEASRDDSGFLKIKDNVVSYRIRKTNDNANFFGAWMSVHPVTDETLTGNIK